MTVSQLLDFARECLARTDPTDGHLAADVLARVVIDLLGEAEPCGMEPFEIIDGELVIGDTQVLEIGGRMSPAGARDYARLLLRGADDAEASVGDDLARGRR